MHISVCGQPFDGDNAFSLKLRCKHEAGKPAFFIHKNTACPALSRTAAFLCACQLQVLPQDIHHPPVRLNIDYHLFIVKNKCYLHYIFVPY